jgi:pilus assembly protein CpaB
MNRQRLRWILAALIAGVCGVYGWTWMRAGSSGSASSPEWVDVVVLRRYLPAQHVVKPSHASTLRYPKALVPPGAVLRTQDLVSENGKSVYLTAVSLPEGSVLTRSVLAVLGERHGLSAGLPQGKVAVSLSVNEVRGVGGWIAPGDSISIYEISKDGAKPAQLLFPALSVLAVDRERVGAPVTDPKQGLDPAEAAALEAMQAQQTHRIVTVLANPLEAALLTTARERGTLSAVLRSFEEEL